MSAVKEWRTVFKDTVSFERVQAARGNVTCGPFKILPSGGMFVMWKGYVYVLQETFHGGWELYTSSLRARACATLLEGHIVLEVFEAITMDSPACASQDELLLLCN